MDQQTGKITDLEKLSRAKQLKMDGNEAYKTKKRKLAIGKYHRSLLHLKGIGQGRESLKAMFLGEDEDKTCPIPPEMVSEAATLQADCYNNLAACLLQDDNPNYEKIIVYCDNVLCIQPDNIKAAYRKGLSLFHIKKYDQALNVFNQIKGDTSVKKYTFQCKLEISKQEKLLKEAYKGMFDKISSST